jgi:hypothetical protein
MSGVRGEEGYSKYPNSEMVTGGCGDEDGRLVTDGVTDMVGDGEVAGLLLAPKDQDGVGLLLRDVVTDTDRVTVVVLVLCT